MANSTTLSGTQISGASAPNPDLCRVSGYLLDPQGSPLAGWSLTLIHRSSPLGLGSNTMIQKERLVFRADADGYLEFDLLRGAVLTAEIPQLATWVPALQLTVPDAASCDLIAFLFPYVVSVAFTDPDPQTLNVDERLTVGLTATLSNGETQDLGSGVVTVESDDENVFSLVEGLTWQARATGVVNLTMTSIDTDALDNYTDRFGAALEFLNLPTPTLATDPLVVTVT